MSQEINSMVLAPGFINERP